MTWIKKLHGSFGTADKKFAGHASDTKRAIETLEECYNQNVPLKDVLDEAQKYLNSHGCTPQHVQEQLSDITAKYQAWLN